MLGDLVELATTVVNPDHTPDIKPHIHGASSSKGAKSMAGSRRRKSQSIPTGADVNGMPPPTVPASTSAALTRKPRSRSTTSPAGSPRPLITTAGKSGQVSSPQSIVKYVGAVVLSIIVEGALQSLSSAFLGTGELAAIAKRLDSWYEIGGLLAYKILLVTFYWFGGFDAFDVLALTLLNSTPQSILLGLFYKIRPSTLVITTAASIASYTLPYLLLRPLSPPHKKLSTRSSTLGLRNRSILTDPYTSLATSLLGATIFAVLFELAFATFLPSFLIAHFTGLRTLEPAHAGSAGLPTLLIALLPTGWACMEFLFAPSTAATSSTATAPGAGTTFDSVRSGFWAHVYWNLWGWYSVRQKELLWRTFVLGALVISETFVFCTIVLKGVSLEGALGYAGLWGAGVAVLGSVLDWVGGPSD